MKLLRIEYKPETGVIKIWSTSEYQAQIDSIVRSQKYFDGEYPISKLPKTLQMYSLSLLAEMEDIEALLEEIQSKTGIPDDQVMGKEAAL